MNPDQIALMHVLEHLFRKGPVNVLVMFPPSRLVTQVIGQVMEQWPDTGIRKTFVERRGFFLAEKNCHASIFFGQLRGDFLSPAFLGKRGPWPTDPPGLVLILG